MKDTKIQKFILTLGVVFVMVFAANAQSDYKTAIGLGLDFGEGRTLVGPSVKTFFNANNAGLGEVTFGGNITAITLLYQYHGSIQNAAGLKWFAGAGPSFFFAGGGSDIAIRPVAGLDYKISNVPLSFSFDWRPIIYFDGADAFLPGRFGLGFRYVIN